MARLDGKDRGLYERPAGSGKWGICYFDSCGKKHREMIGTKAAAKQLYMKRKEEARTGKKLGPLNRKTLTLADLITKYEPEILAKNKKSVSEYQRQGKIWKESHGTVPAADLQSGDIESWKVKRSTTHKPATVNLSLRYLKMLYNLAIRDKLLTWNPLEKGRVKEIRELNQREKVLTPEEEQALEEILPPLIKLAMQVGLHTGLRQAELFERKRVDCNLKKAFLAIPDAKGGGKQYVNLNEEALEAIKAILASHESEWLFPNQYGTGPRDGTSVTKLLQRRCKDLGIEDMTWHALRHTFISRLCMLGVPLPTVQKLARHKSITMTLRYAHLCPSHEQEALALLVKKKQVLEVAPYPRCRTLTTQPKPPQKRASKNQLTQELTHTI